MLAKRDREYWTSAIFVLVVTGSLEGPVESVNGEQIRDFTSSKSTLGTGVGSGSNASVMALGPSTQSGQEQVKQYCDESSDFRFGVGTVMSM